MKWVCVLIIVGRFDVNPPIGAALTDTQDECYKKANEIMDRFRERTMLYRCIRIEEVEAEFPNIRWL